MRSLARAVEAAEETVARGVDLRSPMTRELAPDLRVMPSQKLAPGAIAHLRRVFGRTDDVREEHGSEDGVRDSRRDGSFQETSAGSLTL